MRKVAWLLMFVPFLAMGQIIKPTPNEAYNNSRYVQKNNTGRADSTGDCRALAMTSTLVDTTMGYDVSGFKTLYLTLTANDTCTVLIYYQVSVDGQNWANNYTSAGAISNLQDSLKVKANSYGSKSIDFTSVVLGHPFVRWIFAVDVKAYALGVPTPKYWARYTFKHR